MDSSSASFPSVKRIKSGVSRPLKLEKSSNISINKSFISNTLPFSLKFRLVALALKDNISEKSDYVRYVKDNIFTADLVVFDEVATGSFTRFESENILSIINNRIESGKSNIYTSNLSNQELYEKVGERLYSRIVNCSQEVILVGQDKRGLN